MVSSLHLTTLSSIIQILWISEVLAKVHFKYGLMTKEEYNFIACYSTSDFGVYPLSCFSILLLQKYAVRRVDTKSTSCYVLL